MDPLDQSYILIFLLYSSMTTITLTVFCEYMTTKKTRTKTNQLLTPCYITMQNTGFNLIFIAVPMGLLMTCKLHISWNLGAVGFIAVSEAICNMSIYAMNQLWQHHYTLVIMGFVCTCFQLLMVDLCMQWWWRSLVYFAAQVALESAQILYTNIINPSADMFKQGDGFSTFQSVCIIAMHLLSIWSSAMYTDVILDPPIATGDVPFWVDLAGGCVVWVMFSGSLLLQCRRREWLVWEANRVDDIDAL
jgi:hypothetical protein